MDPIVERFVRKRKIKSKRKSTESLRSAKGLPSDSPIRTHPLSICERTHARQRLLELTEYRPSDLAHSADSLIWRTGPRAIVVPMVSGATCPPKESSMR